MSVSDTELMQRLAGGDQRAFATLTERHAGMVLNVLYRIVLSRDEAEDLCQDVFEKLWLHAGQWQEMAKLSTWLYRVASNLALNHRQRFQARHLVDSEQAERLADLPELEGEASPESLSHQAQRQGRITHALQQLPENQRMAMVFRYYQGLAVKEIAEIMATSPKAIESLLTRARPTLKAHLGDVINDL